MKTKILISIGMCLSTLLFFFNSYGQYPSMTTFSSQFAVSSGPIGIEKDGAGNIFVASTNNSIVQRFSVGGVTQFAVPTNPQQIALDASSNLYIAGFANRVDKYSNTGATHISAISSVEGMTFKNTRGVAFDVNGYQYIADAGNFRVIVMKGNTVKTHFGEPGQRSPANSQSTTLLGYPTDVAVDPSGKNIYVVDQSNNRIMWYQNNNDVFSYKGQFGQKDLLQPWSVACDKAGKVFVTNSGKNNVAIYTVELLPIHPNEYDGADAFIGSPTGVAGNGPGQFSYPTGITIDNSGTIYVCDFNNNRVQLFTQNYCQIFSTNASSGYISNVTIGNMNNNSTYGSTGYADYTSIPNSLLPGSTYTISISTSYASNAACLTQPCSIPIDVWIDFDNDMFFNNAFYNFNVPMTYNTYNEHVLEIYGTTRGTYTGNITIPSGISGKFRMRVVAGGNRSCGDLSHDRAPGEAEDYSLNICSALAAPTSTTNNGAIGCPLPPNGGRYVTMTANTVTNATKYRFLYNGVSILSDYSSIYVITPNSNAPTSFSVRAENECSVSAYSTFYLTTQQCGSGNINETTAAQVRATSNGSSIEIFNLEDLAWDISVLSFEGKEIIHMTKKGVEATIPIEQIPSGLYIIKLNNREGRNLQKKIFIKK